MSDTTMNAAAKLEVKAALLAHAREEFEASMANVHAERAAGELDRDSTISVDDQGQADDAGAMHAIFEGVTDRQREDLERLERLDFQPKQTVVPGAIVGFGGSRYVVGAVADEFSCGGTSYEGIADDSPVYAVMHGLALGDSFEFRGHTHTIDFLA